MVDERDEPWTKDEFMREANRIDPELVRLHHDLIERLENADLVTVRWDGKGGTEASYNVYVPNLRRQVLRVRASGRLQAGVSALKEEGQPKRSDLYRDRLGQWIPEDGGWPWLSKTVADIDFAALVSVVAEVARHPAE